MKEEADSLLLMCQFSVRDEVIRRRSGGLFLAGLNGYTLK